MSSYKSLDYLQAVGLYDVDSLTERYEKGEFQRIRWTAGLLNDYQLRLYHSKVLRMPLSCYDSKAVREMVYYGILQDLADWDRDRAEAWHLARLQERQEAQDMRDRQKRLEGVGLACLVYFLVMCACAVGVCLWAWFRWR